MYEMLVGLEVSNDEVYSQYRAAMKPILESYGGCFRYDFKIAETLKNEEGRAINRVFTIGFESKEKMDQFFSDPKYLIAKNKYFESSVLETTIISEYSLKS